MFEIILFVLFGFLAFAGVLLLAAAVYIRSLSGVLFVPEKEEAIAAAMRLRRFCGVRVIVVADSLRTAEKDMMLRRMDARWNIEAISEDKFIEKGLQFSE